VISLGGGKLADAKELVKEHQLIGFIELAKP
jgi:hypothetical protein